MPDAIIAWLMEGDPAIRWQTMRDLLGAPAAEWRAWNTLRAASAALVEWCVLGPAEPLAHRILVLLVVVPKRGRNRIRERVALHPGVALGIAQIALG